MVTRSVNARGYRKKISFQRQLPKQRCPRFHVRVGEEPISPIKFASGQRPETATFQALCIQEAERVLNEWQRDPTAWAGRKKQLDTAEKFGAMPLAVKGSGTRTWTEGQSIWEMSVENNRMEHLSEYAVIRGSDAASVLLEGVLKDRAAP